MGLGAGGAAGLFTLCLAAAIWYLRRPLPPPHISAYTQITHDGHDKSPGGTDGGRIYFAQVSPHAIAQVGIRGGEVTHVPVAVPELQNLDDVSPDGSNFLVESLADAIKSYVLWDVRIPGGMRYRLGDDWDAAFSPDGLFVCYSTQEGDIYLVRNNGTESHKLSSIRGHTQGLAWSPDGKFIRFIKNNQIWEISSDGSNLHQLLAGWHASSSKCCGRYTPDGRFYHSCLRDRLRRESKSGLSMNDADSFAGRRRSRSVNSGPHPLGRTASRQSRPQQFWGGPIPGKDGRRSSQWAERPGVSSPA